MRPNYLEQVRERIAVAKPGTVYIPSDFFDICEAVKINTCLNRLSKSGELVSVMRGVYAKPRFSNLLNRNIPPCADDVAKAIARNYGWSIVPCGDTALNILGLSTQVPAVYCYVSDGPYKKYEIDGMALQFRHTDSNYEINGVPYQTALLIQALKALGKDGITDEHIRFLAEKIDNEEKERLLLDCRRITAWVYQVIKRICMEESG